MCLSFDFDEGKGKEKKKMEFQFTKQESKIEDLENTLKEDKPKVDVEQKETVEKNSENSKSSDLKSDGKFY